MKTINYGVTGNVATITFNRPDALNALNKATLAELDSLIDIVKENIDIKYVVFTGMGKAFIAGADISEMADMGEKEALRYAETGSKIFRKIELLDKITVALVNGYA